MSDRCQRAVCHFLAQLVFGVVTSVAGSAIWDAIVHRWRVENWGEFGLGAAMRAHGRGRRI